MLIMEEESEDARTIYCGNIPHKVTEDILYELFLQAGPVERVKIPQNNSSRNSNFAFITFQHQCSVDYAIEIYKDTELYGCLLNLQKRHVNERKNGNQNEFNSLAMNNSPIQMTNMYNMMPFMMNPHINPNMMHMYQNVVQMCPDYNTQQKFDRRSPPRRHHSHRNNTPSGRYDNNRSNKRHDDRYDYNYDRRHDHHNDRKRYKR